jgi:peptide/nickel transport system permease protein
VSTLIAAKSPVVETSTEFAGRSLRQIVWSRIRRDKTAMVCLVILIFLYLVAIFAPLITKAIGVDPYAFDSAAISDSGGGPIGPWGGISVNHPLGVEWGTGRDIFAQLLYGLRISLLVATSATIITTFIGTVLGIISGYAGGRTDSIIGRIMDLILAFPFLLIILALSGVLTQRLTQLGIPEGNPSRIVYLILILSFFGWPYLARIVRCSAFASVSSWKRRSRWARADSGFCSRRSCRTSGRRSSCTRR